MAELAGERELHNLREEINRLQARAIAVREVSERVASSADLPALLQAVVDAACELTGARYGALGVFNPFGQIEEFITHGISEDDRQRLGSLPHGFGILGLLQQTQRPLRLSDIGVHPRGVGFPPGHPPMKSFLGVPVRFQNDSLGNLYLTDKLDAPEFTPEDEDVLVQFAAQVALAIRNGRLNHRVETERRRLATILDSSPDGILFVDTITGEVQANRRAEHILEAHFTTTADLAMVLAKCVGPDGSNLPQDQHPIMRALQGEFVAGQEMLLRRTTTDDMPILCSAGPVRGEGTELLGAVMQFQDATTMKEVQRMKDDFFSMVSHDLNAPLAVIRAIMSSAIADAHGAEEIALPLSQAEVVDSEVDWLVDQVANLLYIARLESGAMLADVEECYLADIVDESVQHFLRYRGNETRHVQVDVPADLPATMADYNQVQRVVLNLLVNASKYSEPEQPITVTARIDTPGHLLVEVADRGSGIREEERARLFEKFFRGAEQPQGRRQGYGLGLAICTRIVDSHGGTMTVTSEWGKGSIFAFSLPVTE